jgi:hypothetical protein
MCGTSTARPALRPLTSRLPAEVPDTSRRRAGGRVPGRFGDYQRQLWAIDLGLPVELAIQQVELLATEVVPVLRKEMDSRRAPGVPDAPTHSSLVAAAYGDGETRQARPRPNSGDNTSGPLPYLDSDPAKPANMPQLV